MDSALVTQLTKLNYFNGRTHTFRNLSGEYRSMLGTIRE